VDIVWVLLGGAVIALFIAIERRQRRLKGAPAQIPAPKVFQSGLIEEDVKVSAGGIVCTVLLAFTIVVSVIVVAVSSTVFGQIEAGLFLIWGTLIFGLGIALGREKSYRVYQIKATPPAAPVEPAQPLHDWTKRG
jgi:hypothetical protein